MKNKIFITILILVLTVTAVGMLTSCGEENPMATTPSTTHRKVNEKFYTNTASGWQLYADSHYYYDNAATNRYSSITNYVAPGKAGGGDMDGYVSVFWIGDKEHHFEYSTNDYLCNFIAKSYDSLGRKTMEMAGSYTNASLSYSNNYMYGTYGMTNELNYISGVIFRHLKYDISNETTISSAYIGYNSSTNNIIEQYYQGGPFAINAASTNFTAYLTNVLPDSGGLYNTGGRTNIKMEITFHNPLKYQIKSFNLYYDFSGAGFGVVSWVTNSYNSENNVTNSLEWGGGTTITRTATTYESITQ